MVGDRLVIAFRVGRALRVVDVALVAAANDATGIEDGPDGIGSLGNTGTSELPGPGDSGGVPPPPPPDDGSDSSSN